MPSTKASNINAGPHTFLPLYHSGRGSEFVTTTLVISGHSSICRRRVVHGQVGGGFRCKDDPSSASVNSSKPSVRTRCLS